MGFLLVFGGLCSVISLIALFIFLVADNEFSFGLLAMMLIFAALATAGGMTEHKAKDSCVITIKEYKAFNIERANVSCKKPMLVREIFYDYPNYSVFYNDKKEYEILKIEE